MPKCIYTNKRYRPESFITSVLSLAVVCILTTDIPSVLSAEREPYNDRYCTTCHGTDGKGNEAVEAPRLAGMEGWYLRRQLENFRVGIRGVHPMDTGRHSYAPDGQSDRREYDRHRKMGWGLAIHSSRDHN